MKQCIFNTKDYDSPDGMLTSVWGPNLWHVLHTISFNYPKKPTEKQKREVDPEKEKEKASDRD